MKKAIVLFTAILYSSITFSQTTATTQDGKQVILNDDGTWAYAPKDTTKVKSGTCSDYVFTSEDEMTGDKNVAANEKIILTEDQKTGITFYGMLSTNKKTLILSIKAVGKGCLNENAKINLLFRDGTRKETRGSNKFNCKGSAPIYFSRLYRNQDLLELLMTKELKTIRVSTSSGYIQQDFDSEQSNELLQVLKCLKDNMIK